jgi:hypothetical protein
MACAKSREETEKEIAAEAYEEVGTAVRNPMEVGHNEAPDGGSGDEGSDSTKGGSDGSANDDAFSDESSRRYCFGTSTITLGRIHELVEKGYFSKGEAQAAREETTLDT